MIVQMSNDDESFNIDFSDPSKTVLEQFENKGFYSADPDAVNLLVARIGHVDALAQEGLLEGEMALEVIQELFGRVMSMIYRKESLN